MIKNRLVLPAFSQVWLPLFLSTVLLSLGLLPDAGRASLYFVPEKFSQGHWWLLLSSQFVHINFLHAVFNVAGLLLVYVLVLTKESTVHIVLCTVCCLLCIAGFLAFFPDTYRFYAGFSGVLYGLFFFGGLSFWQHDKMVAVIVLLAVTAKLLWDTAGPAAFERVEWLDARIAVEAHFAGILGAFVFALLRLLMFRINGSI